jgi:hypothetical protein
MRLLSALLCAAGLAVPASGAVAQTLPTWGCKASPSCQQSGFSTYTGQINDHTGILFGVSLKHGVHAELLRHRNLNQQAPQLPEQHFQLHPPAETTTPQQLTPVEREGGAGR